MDHNTSYDDAPETPAPLFALKAFRHALFGTPKADDNTTRPRQTRASTLPNRPARRSVDLGSSPTKGILVTPGTSASKRKRVTFRAQQEREERLKLGATPQAPGHFPTAAAENANFESKAGTDRRGTQKSNRNGTDADHQGSVQLRGRVVVRTEKASSSWAADEDLTTDMSAPRSASGKYWKSEFESFSSKSAEEMKKLTKKERLAKTFAKTRDNEALELRDQLKQEQRKVADLERRLAEYKTRLSQSIDVLQKPKAEGDRNDKHELGATSQRNMKKDVQQDSQEEADIVIGDKPAKARPFAKSNHDPAMDNKQAVTEPVEPDRHFRAASDRGFMQRIGPASGFPSSDIWADIGNTSEAVQERQNLQPDAPTAPFSMKSPARRPLRQRSANFEGKTADGPETKKISEERRAAAMKRIGERRKIKRNANSTGS